MNKEQFLSKEPRTKNNEQFEEFQIIMYGFHLELSFLLA